MRIDFSRLAANELKAAVAWYNLQRLGWGQQLRAEIRLVLKGIVTHPHRWAFCGTKYRRAVLTRFPYVIYYEPAPDVIRVARIVHASRDRAPIEELLP